jgi:hypothetical protein
MTMATERVLEHEARRMREVLREARSIIIAAVEQAVDIPGFDPTTHTTVVKIDEALRNAAPGPIAAAGEADAIRDRAERAEAELRNIANATPEKWGDMRDQFREWAQSRARDTLRLADAAAAEATSQDPTEHQRLAEAVEQYLDAIGCEESGDMPTILLGLAADAINARATDDR